MEEAQLAFLLHSRPYKEHQLLIDLLTEHDGKVSAVISSGHSLKANKKGILQPFSLFSIQLSGKHQLKKASRLESANQTFNLVGTKLYSGLYLNELLVRLLLENVPCPAVFQQYFQSLTALIESDEVEPVLREFEMALIDELGLSFDFNTLAEINSESVQFVVEQGFQMANNSSRLPIFDKKSLLALANGDYSETATLVTHKRLMRQVLNHLLGHKPLKSRELFMAREQKL